MILRSRVLSAVAARCGDARDDSSLPFSLSLSFSRSVSLRFLVSLSVTWMLARDRTRRRNVRRLIGSAPSKRTITIPLTELRVGQNGTNMHPVQTANRNYCRRDAAALRWRREKPSETVDLRSASSNVASTFGEHRYYYGYHECHYRCVDHGGQISVWNDSSC